MNRTSHLIILCVGFAATIAQVVLMRELVVAFYGNEISLGLMLGGWLVWTAAGSTLFGRVADRRQLGTRTLILLLLALALLLPATLMGARLVRFVLGVSGPGEILPFETIAWSTLLLLGPICFVNGSLFVLLCRLAASREKRAEGVGRVYLFEAVGSVLGGSLFTLVLVRLGSSLLAGCLGSALLAVLALWLAWGVDRGRALWRSGAAVCGLLIVLGVLLAGPLDRWSTQVGWRPYEVKAVLDSAYGRLVFLDYAEQKTILSNGHILASHPPGAEAEDLAHFAMLSRRSGAAHARVLLIGGGLSGVLSELGKYPIESAQYVELDRTLLESGSQVFPDWFASELRPAASEGAEAGSAAGITVLLRDGRELIDAEAERQASGAGGYDVILIDLPAPYNAQLNRFYTEEFFRSAAAALRADGLLVFAVPGSDAYVSPMLQRFLQSIRRSVRGACECCDCFGETAPPLRPAKGSEELFNVSVVPGATCLFLCSRGERPPLDAAYYERRLSELGIETEYFQAGLRERLRADKADQLRLLIGEGGDAPVNSDLNPICYLYDAVLWSSMFRLHGAGGEAGVSGIGRLLLALQKVRAWWLGVGAAALTVAVALLGRWSLPLRRSFLPLAVGATGFAQITAEILCLIGFQVAHGTVYYLVGGIVAAYMAGLSAGSYGMVRWMGRWDRPMLVGLQVGIAVYQVVIAALMGLLIGAPSRAVGLSIFGFGAITFVAGFLGGFQFPLAAKLFLGASERTGERAGVIYGADLFGSCLGAVLASAVMVPLLGIVGTAMASAAVVGLSVVLLSATD